MTTATAVHATTDRASRQTAAPTPASTTAAAPTKPQGLDHQTKVLAAVTGAGIVIVLVFFLGLIAILGANGRAQRAHSTDHPVPPVTRVAR